MPGIGDRRNKLKILDGELLCALYIRLGSYEKVAARLVTEGIVNPENGKEFSRAGIRSAVTRSVMYFEYLKKRELDPSMSPEPTEAEFAECLKVIAERIPMQKKALADAVKEKENRQADWRAYMEELRSKNAKEVA